MERIPSKSQHRKLIGEESFSVDPAGTRTRNLSIRSRVRSSTNKLSRLPEFAIIEKKMRPRSALWSDYSKYVGGQFIRIRLKIAQKCCFYLDIFNCVKINVFHSFFAFRLQMHVRCDNQYKTGSWSRQGKYFWDSRCRLCAWVSAF